MILKEFFFSTDTYSNILLFSSSKGVAMKNVISEGGHVSLQLKSINDSLAYHWDQNSHK